MWPPEKSLRYIREVEGMEVLEEALASGDGLVGITSHLGNWEVLNHFYCSYAKPIIFYRPPKLKAVDELLKKQRVQLGNRVAPSTPEGILSVIKEVKKGGCVGIPADPEPARTAGLFVPYLGTTALISKFVPQLLSRGKARGVFFHAVRLPDGSGYKVILEAAPADMYDKDLEVSVAAMSRELAKYVRAYPSQYMWSMKRFKNRPDGEKMVLRKGRRKTPFSYPGTMLSHLLRRSRGTRWIINDNTHEPRSSAESVSVTRYLAS